MAKKEKIKFQEKIQGKQELKYHLIFCSIIFILTFTVYFNSLKNGFVHDDNLIIVDNNFIKDIRNIKHIFSSDYFKSSWELTYRPIVTLTYFIDYFLYKLNPAGFHLTNILFHILNSILIYFFALTIFRKYSLSLTLSLFTSLLYSLHPIATEPVNAISFREDLLAMSFFLISWLLYIKYFTSKKPYLYLFSLISFIISLFSKESAVVLPLILILYDFSFSNVKEVLKRKYFYSIYFIILLIYIYLTRYSILSNPYYIPKPYQETGGGYFTFLTMLKVFASYIKLLILPTNLKLEHIIPISHSLINPEVILSILVLIASIIIAILMYKKNKIIFFAIFYFFICLAPVSNIIRIVLLMAERFLYIPYLGFCIIISIIFFSISKFITLRLSYFLFILLISFYSYLTFNQNKIWKNELILYETTIKKSPNSSSAYNGLGVVYEKKGDLYNAEKYYKKAIELKKDFAMAYNNLGNIYRKKGDLDKAEKYCKKAIEIDKYHPIFYITLGVIYGEKGEIEKAKENFEKAIELNRFQVEAYYNLGVVYEMKGQLEKAEKYYKKTISINKNYTDAYFNLGVIYVEKGSLDEAEEYFKKTLELEKNSDKKQADIYYNLGVIYKKKGLLDKAKEYFEKANELNKNYKVKNY